MGKQEESKNNVFAVLKRLVSIPSYGQIGKEHQIIKYLKMVFNDCCDKIEIEDKNGNIHLLIGVNHELKNIENSIILSGHIDTVRESERHNCDVTIEDNNLKGLGISDMKSFVATIIANLDYLKSLEIPVIISLTSDEETNLIGIQQIINELKNRKINSSMVIVGEPTNLDYYISSRGNSIYVSIMNGVSCHSGTPELGINAIELQTKFITEIIKVKVQTLKDAAICITHIDGGRTPSNVVPDISSLCFGIRTSDSKILDTIYDYLIEKHKEISNCYGDSKLFNVLEIPPFERKKSEFLNSQAEASEKQMLDAQYATEAGYFQKVFSNANVVIYGPGIPDGIHSSKETITTDNLIRYEVELKDMLDNYLTYIKTEENKLGIQLIKNKKR